MSAEARYVAVHLGENALSVLVDTGGNVAERRYRTALSMHAGELMHLDDDETADGDAAAVAVDNQPGSDADTTVERSLWSFVADRNVLVGSVAVPVDSAIRGTVEAALRRTGAAGPVRLLEIACPSSWGVARQNIVRRAVTPLAHEVVVVDTATAAVESLGERAPEFGVVVEIGELTSTVSGVSLDSDTADGELFFVGSGRWDAIGNRDIVAGDGIASIRQRITDCVAAQGGRRDVDVFVVDTTPDEDAAALAVEPTHRSHRLTGLDVIRSMAARAGVGAAMAPSAPRVEPRDVPDAGPAMWPSAAPMSARSAAWLDDLHNDPPERAVPMRAVAFGAAVVVVAVTVALLGYRALAPSPPASESSVTAAAAVPDASEPTDTPEPTHTPTTAPAVSSAAPILLPEYSRFAFGRVSVEMPSLWSARSEPDRLVLVPPEFPDRRIVVSTVELAPGASFDDVADDLTGQMEESGQNSTVGSFTRATDFDGRVGMSYTENPQDGSSVHWRVFVEDGMQISIGCQGTEGSEAVLADECARAVSTLEISPAGP